METRAILKSIIVRHIERGADIELLHETNKKLNIQKIKENLKNDTRKNGTNKSN